MKREKLPLQEFMQILEGNRMIVKWRLNFLLRNRAHLLFVQANSPTCLIVHADIEFFRSDGLIDVVVNTFDYTSSENIHSLDHHM